MEKWSSSTNKIKFILYSFLFYLSLEKNTFSQTFDLPENFIESPLIYSHETNLKGISRILPVKNSFSKYTVLELSLVQTNINYPSDNNAAFDEYAINSKDTNQINKKSKKNLK